MDTQALASREVGQYALSIATSLAIESFTGIHPERTWPHPPIQDYQELWVNLSTLYRNLLGAVQRDDLKLITEGGVAQALLDEVNMLHEIIQQQSQGRCKVVLYTSDYANLASHYPHALLRTDNTAKQLEYTANLQATVGRLLDLLIPFQYDVHTFTRQLRPKQRSKAAILTHYAFDLLSEPEFTRLTLLESHTGNLKERGQFYTKYVGGNQLQPLPFTEGLLQLFGDSETFRPQANKLRREVTDLAASCHWTPLTTRSKIRTNVELDVKNPWAKALLLQLLR